MVGIICAMEAEMKGLLKLMQKKSEVQRSGMIFHGGKIGNTPVVLAQCGVGKVNAAICAQLMIDLFSPDSIINSGVAGALSEKVTVCDVVIGDYAVQHDFDCTALGEEKACIECGSERLVKIPLDKELAQKLFEGAGKNAGNRVFMGTIASGDKFVSATEERLEIGKSFSALACEMEGGAMAQVCYRAKVPFGIIRCISDDLNHNDMMSFYEFMSVAAEKTVDILTAVLS
ncbi:MAG: 5'-methylthioadenosine/adenosylhomocysteine nucleosidase [Ruminococcus sp.]